MGEYVPELVPGRCAAARPTLKPLRDHPAGGRRRSPSTATCCSGRTGRCGSGFNYREGLVLHTVGYDDDGRRRSIAHRLSFAEMVVPYRDPTADHYRRTAFDIGEWGLGFMTTSLELGCDCLGEIRYLDAVLHDTRGRAATRSPTRSASTRRTTRSCGSTSTTTPAPRSRRTRRLVVSFHVTVANYEYLVYWRFYQDGNIECEVRATGIMVTTQLRRGRASRPTARWSTSAPTRRSTSTSSSPGSTWTSTATDNTVYATESEAAADRPGQPVRAGAGAAQHPAAHRGGGQAGLRLGHASARWKVVNDNVRNGLGTPVGYKLVPERRASRRCSTRPRRSSSAPQVIGHTLWVTPYRAGRALAVRRVRRSRARDDTGLPAWTAAEPLDREHRRRALVRLRHPPHHPAGGLAGHAGRHRLVLAQAVRLLRPQPRARRRSTRRARPAAAIIPSTSTSARLRIDANPCRTLREQDRP